MHKEEKVHRQYARHAQPMQTLKCREVTCCSGSNWSKLNQKFCNFSLCFYESNSLEFTNSHTRIVCRKNAEENQKTRIKWNTWTFLVPLQHILIASFQLTSKKLQLLVHSFQCRPNLIFPAPYRDHRHCLMPTLRSYSVYQLAGSASMMKSLTSLMMTTKMNWKDGHVVRFHEVTEGSSGSLVQLIWIL